MDLSRRIELALELSLRHGTSSPCPPRLAGALRHAVFPGGGRIRPRLAVGVARAIGEDEPLLVDAAASAVELLHCASLVHDDLPCFDDADVRRGRPSVHAAFGEPLAVLAGDALIVLAFETLGRAGATRPDRLPRMVAALSRGVGAPHGIVAGQAWESEADVSLAAYHRAKTGALFEAAAVLGAQAAGADGAAWAELGRKIGEAYQVADDIADAVATPGQLGKPVGQDVVLARPSAVRELGLTGAVHRLRVLLDEALESVPACRGRAELRLLLETVAARLVPSEALASLAATG